MAIKGKKKSQSRGSQGARRPAAAPRPTATARRKTSWWRTRDGLLIGGIFLVVAIGVVVWLVVSAQDRAKQLEEEQTALEQYTQALQPALDALTPPATEMIGFTSLPQEDELDDLADDAEQWVTDLQSAQALVQQQFAPEGAESVNDLVSEAATLYITAAQSFGLLAEAEGDLRDQIFTRATSERDSAGRVLSGAIGALDSLRSEKDLGASGLRSPIDLPVPAPSELPSPEAGSSPEAESSPEGGSSSESGGGGGGEGKKDGKKNNGKDDASGG